MPASHTFAIRKRTDLSFRVDRKPNLKVICQSCHRKEHIAPQCTFNFHKPDHGTYDGLATEEKVKVPDNSSKNAKAYLAITKFNRDESATKKETNSKYYRGVY